MREEVEEEEDEEEVEGRGGEAGGGGGGAVEAHGYVSPFRGLPEPGLRCRGGVVEKEEVL
jgi:hypothetical protein